MKIGYARSSTDEQNMDLQIDALKAAGCNKIFTDYGVGALTKERKGLSQALTAVRDGNNTLVVWKLDRLGRSVRFLCDLIKQLKEQGAEFQSLSDGIDTAATNGELVFHIMATLAEFERDLLGERTKAGMNAAKKRGKHAGRPKALSSGQIRHMQELLDEGRTQGEVSELLGVSPSTVGRELKRNKNITTNIEKA